MSAPAVYLVKGDDSTLVDQAMDRMVSELLGDRPRDLTVEECALDASAESIIDVCQTPVFLSDKRIVIARQIGRFKAADVVPLIDYLASPMPTTVLILGAGGGGAVPTKLGKAVKESGHLIETAVATGKQRQSWVNERVKASSVTLTPGALSRLTDALGDELGLLEGVLDALTVAFGEGSRIDEESLVPYLTSSGASAPWELTDAIDAGDVATALVQLRRMLAGDRHPLAVMATIQRHLANLLRLDGAGVTSESEAASMLGISPFPAKKALAQANRLGTKNILRAIELASAADVELRGNSGWPGDMTLEVLVARLARLTPPRHGKRPSPR